MSFLDLLQDLGDRLGILEAAEEPAAQTTAKIQTRTVTLAELATEICSEEVRALADLPAELTVPFEKIFETAGIRAPANGWNVDRLKQLLLTDAFKDKELGAVQKAILNILNSENVPVEDVVKDAMARDKALDSFEAFARKKIEDRMGVRERQISEIEAQIKALQSDLDGLREKAKIDQEKWREWRRQKRAAERELARTVGYLIDRQVITTNDDD
jgi:hypothetical protein